MTPIDYNAPTKLQLRFEHLCALLGASDDVGDYADADGYTGEDFDNLTAHQRAEADARQDRGR